MRLLVFAVLFLSVSACDYGARRQVSNLTVENQSLQNQLQISSDYIQDVTEIMDEVQRNLNQIEEREGVIGRISLESSGTERRRARRALNVREELLTSISDIDAFIMDNREKMEALNERILESNVRIESLERLVDNLTVTVQEKEKNVVQLKERVKVLEADIASLQGRLFEREATLQVRDSTIAEQEEAMRAKDQAIQAAEIEAATGYYAIGTREALKKSGLILERRAGFLGLKKTASVGTILPEYFHGVPKSQAAISLSASVDDIEIVSGHRDRPDLFRFDDSNDAPRLIINDPEAFWSISDYLLIIAEN